MFKKVALILATVVAGVSVASVPASATPPPSVPSAATSVDVTPLVPIQPPAVTKASDLKPLAVSKLSRSSRATKGFPGVKTSGPVTLAKTSATSLARTTCSGGCYFYTGGYEDATTTGCAAKFSVDWSYVDVESSDPGAHSLSECAIETGTGSTRQIVEVLITRDDSMFNPGSDGDDDPHLEVYHWKNGSPIGYGTNFVRFTGTGASPYGPGDSLVSLAGTVKQMDLVYINQTGIKGWWVYFDAKPVGYFPADPAGTSTATNLWYPGTFTSGTRTHFFWEVYSTFHEPCTDAGNGYWGSQTFALPWDYNWDPSQITSATRNGGTVNANLTLRPNTTVNYDSQFILSSTQHMLGGGGGFTASGADWGARNSC